MNGFQLLQELLQQRTCVLNELSLSHTFNIPFLGRNKWFQKMKPNRNQGGNKWVLVSVRITWIRERNARWTDSITKKRLTFQLIFHSVVAEVCLLIELIKEHNFHIHSLEIYVKPHEMYTICTETFSDFCWFSNWKLYAFAFNWCEAIRHSTSDGVTIWRCPIYMTNLKYTQRRRRRKRRDSFALKASNDEVLVICIVTSSYGIIIITNQRERLFK